jgi:hypothetical protein
MGNRRTLYLHSYARIFWQLWHACPAGIFPTAVVPCLQFIIQGYGFHLSALAQYYLMIPMVPWYGLFQPRINHRVLELIFPTAFRGSDK